LPAVLLSSAITVRFELVLDPVKLAFGLIYPFNSLKLAIAVHIFS
jgi:hypothetical protein